MEPFIGTIMAFGFNFAPRGWAECNGQLLPISQNSALFSLLGTTYGGDGKTTFGLPDLRGRTAIHQGHGAGLSDRRMGTKTGEESVTLSLNQIPAHKHNLKASASIADQASPENSLLAIPTENAIGANVMTYEDNTGNLKNMNTASIENNGGGQGHSNMQPSLTINYCIALVGIYPSRS